MSELSGQGSIALPQPTSVATSDAVISLMQRARDNNGNEYLYVSFSETLRAGQWVVVRNGVAARLAPTSRGPVGIVCADTTSTQNSWVQIYGIYDTAQLNGTDVTNATSAYFLGATLDTTEAGADASSVATLTTNLILGAWPIAASTSATTLSSSAHTGVTQQVQLNYPYVLGFSPSESTDASS